MNSTLVIKDAPVALRLPSPPRKRAVFYPETDGKPMGETDTHRNQMFDHIETLKRFFADQPDVYVTGNIMFYYEPGNPYKSISPDVMVVKGVAKGVRRVFKLWEERPPSVVFEISSKSTKREDFEKKLRLYARFGAPEYYIFDPEQRNPAKAWAAFHLTDGAYQQVEIVNGRVFSPELGLEIVQTGQELRFFNPVTQQFLINNEELEPAFRRAEAERQQAEAEVRRAQAATQRAEAERQRAETERQRAEAECQRAEAERDAESAARQEVEADLARALAELAQLRRA